MIPISDKQFELLSQIVLRDVRNYIIQRINNANNTVTRIVPFGNIIGNSMQYYEKVKDIENEDNEIYKDVRFLSIVKLDSTNYIVYVDKKFTEYAQQRTEEVFGIELLIELKSYHPTIDNNLWRGHLINQLDHELWCEVKSAILDYHKIPYAVDQYGEPKVAFYALQETSLYTEYKLDAASTADYDPYDEQLIKWLLEEHRTLGFLHSTYYRLRNLMAKMSLIWARRAISLACNSPPTTTEIHFTPLCPTLLHLTTTKTDL